MTRSVWIYFAICLISLSTSDAETVIEIGTSSIPEAARPWFESEVHKFDDAHPDVSVKLYRVGEGRRPATHIKDLPRMARNVVGIQAPIGDEISYLASREYLRSLDRLFEDPEFDKSVFVPGAFSSAEFDGKVYGVPWSLDGFWLVCDWPLFEKEGIQSPPRTWPEFMEYAKRLTKDVDGDGKADQFGVRFPHMDTGMIGSVLFSMNEQDGVKYTRDGRADLSNPAFAENIKFMIDLLSSGSVFMDDEFRFAASVIDEGPRTAMQFAHNAMQQYQWAHDSIEEIYENPHLRFAPLPTDGASAWSVGERFYLCIRKSAPKEEAASWEFLKWMTRKDISLDNYWYGWPARVDIIEREDFKTWANSTSVEPEVAVRSMAGSRTPDIKYDPDILGAAQRHLGEILGGSVSISDGLSALEEELNGIMMDTPRPLNPDALFE